MMRRLLVPPLVAAALAHAQDASGSCASAVVVDGQALFGAVVQHPRLLPPGDGEHDAIFPACNDTGGDEPDQRTTVLRLRGLPPRVGVAERGRSGAVYVDGPRAAIVAACAATALAWAVTTLRSGTLSVPPGPP
jgi:hypothetical protein